VAEDRFIALCDGCTACAPTCLEAVIRLDGDRRPISRMHGANQIVISIR
jgi:hypothetical protein